MNCVAPLDTLADSLRLPDGCLKLFAGPMKKDFSASVNLVHIQVNFTLFVGTTGGDAEHEAEAE